MKNTENTYAWPHIIIHWVVALTVFGLFFLGLWMVTLDYYSVWYHRAPLIHQSVGILLVLLMVFRLYWRRYAGVPKSPTSHKVWEKRLAGIVHAVLYVSVISMFFTGYLIATVKGQPLSFFGILDLPSTVTGIDNLEDISARIHLLTAYSIVTVAAFHALAAIKHHFIDKDATLLRMLKPKLD